MRWHHCLWWNSEFSINIDLPLPLLENITGFKMVIQIATHNSWHAVMLGVMGTLFSIFRMEQVQPTVEMENFLDHLLAFSLRCLLGKHSSIWPVLSIPFYPYLTAALLIKSILWTSFTSKDCESELCEGQKTPSYYCEQAEDLRKSVQDLVMRSFKSRSFHLLAI